MQERIQDPEPKTQDAGRETRDAGLGTRDPRRETQDPEPKTQDPGPEAQDRISQSPSLSPASCVLSLPAPPVSPGITPPPDAMLVSVGGSPAPVVASLCRFRPDRVIFFVSAHTRALVSREILPRLAPGPLPDHEFILTPDEQDLGACIEALMAQVPQAMARLSLAGQWPGHVDYTGGTKTMSAALVWAASRHSRSFSYVGAASAASRTKGGVGVVADGQELPIFTANPWERICLFEMADAAIAFNQCRYALAAEFAAKVKERLASHGEDSLRAPFVHLHGIFAAYADWDGFRYREAAVGFERHADRFRAAATHPRLNLVCDFSAFASACAADRERLRTIDPQRASWARIHDLLANARRRALVERKFDDAVARVYSAIEKAAHHELRKAYGIDASNAQPEQIPPPLRDEYLRRYASHDPATGRPRLQFGLVPAYHLLLHLDNPLGQRFQLSHDRILARLGRRNQSFLAHGADPITLDDWQGLHDAALSLLDIDDNALPDFPRLDVHFGGTPDPAKTAPSRRNNITDSKKEGKPLS